MSFKRIGEKEIKSVEVFVQTELKERIDKKCEQLNLILSENDAECFFGTYHTDHQTFQFGGYERDIISKLVQHLKHIFATKGFAAAIEYFSKPNNDEIDWLNGWFYKPKSTTSNNVQTVGSINETPTGTHKFLNKLLETADQNSKRPKGGFRFDYQLKSFAAFLRMLAGRMAYELLQQNLPLAFPSLSTIDRDIRRTQANVIEGVPRCHELLQYLKDRNLPLAVCLSEDATRIINRVQYDSSTNQLIGFVLPTDNNGMPIPFSYKARSSQEIVDHFSNGIVSNFVNTIMAKPCGNAPAFCVLIFGSGSSYTGKDVANRWEFMTNELKKVGISVVTIASDSDPKYNCAMRILSDLAVVSNHHPNFGDKEWFSCGHRLDAPFYVQDTIHLLLKLRNLLLKTRGNPEKLKFGPNFYIRMAHLQYLIDNFSKDKHLLTRTTLNPVDKQNFRAVVRLCDSKVTNLLRQHVPDSDATVKFLEMLRDMMDAFMDTSLSPQQCIEKMWYPLFLMRLWRQYVDETEGLEMSKNFLTSNSYYCVELNAHSLLSLIIYLKKSNQPHLFRPIHFSSQPCEEFYRQIRSFTTVYSTVANCTTKEILGRINKIQLQNEISALNTEYFFPRSSNSNVSPTVNIDLPSEEEIIKIVETCQTRAIQDALEMGILAEPVVNIPCGCAPYRFTVNIRNKFAALTIDDEASNAIDLESADLKNFANKFQHREVDEASPYVEIHEVNERKIFKKITLCWFLSKDTVKLSSDRLARVKNSYAQEANRGHPNRMLKKIQIGAGRKLKRKRKQHAKAIPKYLL